MPYRETTRVPLAPEVVKGLMNLRGETVMAVDLRGRFGSGKRLTGGEPMNVVVHTTNGPVSLLVDEIGYVVEVDDSMFESVPETVQSSTRNLVRAVYKLAGRLLLAIDIERILDFSRLPVEKETEAAEQALVAPH